MINLLVGIIAFQFLFLLYQDYSNRKEREKLELLLKSENIKEYQDILKSPSPKQSKETIAKKNENPYIPIEDVPFEKLIKAKDNL